MTEEEMRKMLNEAVAQAGGTRAFARTAGMNHSVVSLAQSGGVVSPKLLAALGLTRITTYARVTP